MQIADYSGVFFIFVPALRPAIFFGKGRYGESRAIAKCGYTELSQNCSMRISLQMYGHSWSGNLDRAPQTTEETPEDRLRGIFADADAIARRAVR